MKLARVIGNVVSTVKTESHRHRKLIVVEPVDMDHNNIGESLIAADSTQSGIGDIVIIVEEGGSVRQVLGDPKAAIDAVIVGIVDETRKTRR